MSLKNIIGAMLLSDAPQKTVKQTEVTPKSYFKPSEFACKCGKKTCKGLVDMPDELVAKLNKARELAGIPFIITSAIRCPEHNKKVGGVEGSSHVLGLAVDVSAPDGNSKWKVVKAAMEAGFTRVGVAKTFIHLDMDTSKPQHTIWLY